VPGAQPAAPPRAMKVQVPDPRRFESDDHSPLMRSAEELASASDGERPRLRAALAGEITALLESGSETTIRQALLHPSSAQAARALSQALDAALVPPSRSNGVNLYVFAIPILFVVSSQSAHNVSAVLPDSDAIRSLFEQSGVLGHCRNFGLSNALASLEAVQAIPWTTLHSIVKTQTWNDFAAIELAPADVEVTANRESVHLRFICGAALTAASAPAFVESAGDIGRWGMQLTKELGQQLATPDFSLLAIPRAPRSIVRAASEGWFAARELGFQLFLSNALRQARMRFGEPDVVVSAGSDDSIRIRLTSPFDELFDQTYGWPLSPSDDFDEIVNSIAALLDEVRVKRVQVMPNVEQVTGAQWASL